jgi:ABC-type branched-subunit amino acid transport system substrate-binding protein
MDTALAGRGIKVNSQPASSKETFELAKEWQADLIYVVFSSEQKALPVARRIRERLKSVPILFGRSLLRESFLFSLDESIGEAWFVDMFHRDGTQTESQRRFMRILSDHGVAIPTANHAFGWDAMSFCALALEAAREKSPSPVDYLESGIPLDGVTGTCTFSRDNHNGRGGFGPTTLTRWTKGRLEEV